MSTTEFDAQPVQDQNDSDMEVPSGEEDHEPGQKSTVYNDPFKVNQTRKYADGDKVSMKITQDGRLTKGVFNISEARLHSSGSYVQYQLVDAYGRLYEKGKWFRERDLNMERKR